MFPEDCIRMNRVRVVNGNQVQVIFDRQGNCHPLNAIGESTAHPVSSARWLPNGEIEVVFEKSEIRHYTSLNNYYIAGFDD